MGLAVKNSISHKWTRLSQILKTGNLATAISRFSIAHAAAAHLQAGAIFRSTLAFKPLRVRRGRNGRLDELMYVLIASVTRR